MRPAHSDRQSLLCATRRLVSATQCLLAASLGAGGLAGAAHAADPAGSCVARSGATVPPVVELYTSEGCSSCPPADRWLSKLTTQPEVIALAFHVDYWDNLGWTDPFGSPAHTERQYQQLAVNGSRFSYTPQVAINGVDNRHWPSVRPPVAAASATPLVQVQLSRDGERYSAVVKPSPGAPAKLAAYWAVTENQHVSAVKSGENRGATLAHDFVVREYRPVPAWVAAGGGTQTLTFDPAPAARSAAAHPRHINLIVVDAASGRPVQAVKLGC